MRKFMKKCFSLLSIFSLLLLSLCSYAQLFMLRNDTPFTVQFIYRNANNIPSDFKSSKDYAELAPKQMGTGIYVSDIWKGFSIKWATGLKWDNVDIPMFAQQIESERAQHPDQMPVIAIGTRALGTMWDIKLIWVKQ
jgi:hypothetical protein